MNTFLLHDKESIFPFVEFFRIEMKSLHHDDEQEVFLWYVFPSFYRGKAYIILLQSNLFAYVSVVKNVCLIEEVFYLPLYDVSYSNLPSFTYYFILYSQFFSMLIILFFFKIDRF